MKTIKAVYKRLGDMILYYTDGSKKKLEEMTETELQKADTFCSKHHIHTDGNIVEFAGAVQPLHCIILCQKPFSYTVITTYGTTFTISDKSPQELLQRCEKYIESCETIREYSSNIIKYSCGEGGI